MTVRIFYDDLNFRLNNWKRVRSIIEEVISNEGKVSGDLNFIITTDNVLREINVRFLEHDYFTDVITFKYNENLVINGEVYISLDTVRLNSKNYEVSLQNEMLRVVIHGVLHLCGYDDGSDKEKANMRLLEDKWMKLFNERI